jgi:hypothetical protein
MAKGEEWKVEYGGRKSKGVKVRSHKLRDVRWRE